MSDEAMAAAKELNDFLGPMAERDLSYVEKRALVIARTLLARARPPAPDTNETLVTRIADALINKIRSPYSYSNITNIIRGCVSREDIRVRVSQPTPSPMGTELAFNECKIILKHLVASIEHEIRVGTLLLGSTIATCGAGRAFLANVPVETHGELGTHEEDRT
jgi:hypothetical protein